jgi:hypothetical protein
MRNFRRSWIGHSRDRPFLDLGIAIRALIGHKLSDFFPPYHTASRPALIRLGLAQIKPSIHEIAREQSATPRGPTGHRTIAIRGERLNAESSGCRAH